MTSHTIKTITLDNCNPDNITPVLLVPGILGSTTTGTVGVYPNLPATPPAWGSGELKLHDPGFYEEEIGFSFTNPVGFKKIKEKLKENHSYQQNCTIFDAPYYWADSSEKNARDYLKNYIDHAKLISGQSQVDIIAHSMGGIVTRSYIQNEDLYENDVHKFAMVRTPNQGSPLPYFIYEGGDVIGADKVTGNINSTNPSRYLYTHSLNKLYQSKYREKICKHVPVFLEETNIFGIDNLFYEPACDRAKVYQFARNNIPGIKELLFTYGEALFNHETSEFIDYPVNESLINLNTNYDILNTNIETKLFVGIEDENTTLRTLVVLPNHNDFLYQDYGYPQYEYPVRHSGDGTVPQVSIEIPNLDVYGTYDEGHGSIPNKAAEDLVEYITQN